MLVPKQNRKAIYNALFKDGVLCAKKDLFLPKHHDIEVPNLHVIKLMESFVSKGLVTVVFNWQWFYWTLTDKGIEYLRSYMSLPEDIVPNSMKQSAKKLAPRRQFDDEQGAGRGGFRGGRGGFRGGRGGRDEYRGPRGDGEGGFRGGRGGFRGGRGGTAQ